MRGQRGFFDVDDRLKRLSDLGDRLEAFRATVDFELFRAELNLALSYSDGSEGGRPPFDPVMMFKILVIQATNNLSDERAEFLINDRLSFMRFLGLGLAERVPDARTIWLFREKLTKAGAIKTLFERFDATLRQAGYIAMSGQIVDASLIAAPRQHNSEDEKQAIKGGRIPKDWKDKPAKLRQKDRHPIIRRTDLGATGIYYRALVGPLASVEEAKSEQRVTTKSFRGDGTDPAELEVRISTDQIDSIETRVRHDVQVLDQPARRGAHRLGFDRHAVCFDGARRRGCSQGERGVLRPFRRSRRV
jgi:transposase